MKLTTEAKVGLLVFAGILLLTFMSFRVGEFRMASRSGKSVHVLFDSAAGLTEDASVQIAGVEVGRVEKIGLLDGRADVTVRIDTDIPRDSQARIRSVGLLGDKYVELDLGHAPQSVKDGETLMAPATTEDVGQLVGKLSAIADDLKSVTSSLRGALGGAEGERSIRELLQSFHDVTLNLNNAIQKSDARIARVIENMDNLSTSLNRTIIENLASFQETLIHTRSATRSMDSIFRKVDEGQGTLGRLVNEGNLSDNLEEVLVSAQDVLGVKKKYNTYVSLRGENLVEANDTKGYVSLKLQPRKDKFFLFELVSPEGTKGDRSETLTTRRITNTGPGAGTDFFPTEVTQTVQERETSDDMLFTAMFGKTFGQTSFRLGLEESTGGIGVDHTLLGRRLGLHLDLWDMEGENSFGSRAHAKFRADYNFLKYFHVNAGYDNFLNAKDSSLFYGASISFQDEDIKDLFGFLPMR